MRQELSQGAYVTEPNKQRAPSDYLTRTEQTPAISWAHSTSLPLHRDESNTHTSFARPAASQWPSFPPFHTLPLAEVIVQFSRCALMDLEACEGEKCVGTLRRARRDEKHVNEGTSHLSTAPKHSTQQSAGAHYQRT
ncbi:unnamed protein product [Pleuronectes platessa]|uniref:Uncharacterized protein n=1 Tax=Pleuronectes platessa TaxID=8262 RepID=A0A9N7UFF1_PLEPL|nr:unnamed protein product [Pleuronectes platessa]